MRCAVVTNVKTGRMRRKGRILGIRDSEISTPIVWDEGRKRRPKRPETESMWVGPSIS